ncbi:MAG: tetratricopeptide repeat protein [Crocinitomicaceae bacterium]|nr:tetratricopeptide repeat protein [Crocinitomicaceae bacterium]
MRLVITLLILVLSNGFVLSQTNLEKNYAKLANPANDTAKVNALNFLAKYHINVDQDSSHFYVKNALILAEKLKYERGIGFGYLTSGILESDMGNYPEALKYILDATSIAEKIKDFPLLSGCKLNLGNFYIKTNDYDKALDIYREGLAISRQHNLFYSEASLLSSYGLALRLKGELDSSIFYYEKVLEIHHTTLHDSVVIAALYNNMASAHFAKGDIKTAENYLVESYKINKLMGNQRYMILNLSNLAELSGMEEGNIKESRAYFDEAIAMAKKARSKEALESIYLGMSETYYNHKIYDEAYLFLKLSLVYKDSVIGDGKHAEIMQISEEFKTRQIQDSLTIKEKELQLSQSNELAAELKASKTTWQLLGALIIMVAVIIVLIVVYRHSKNQKKINALLQDKNEEINHQKLEIEEKNTELTDSINYAKRIQQAILPSPNYMAKVLGDHFLIFRPKDIVSGDFYWIKQQSNRLYFAVADCTGHGVPGAMVSMLGFETIERVSGSEISDAAIFVNKINDALVTAFTARSEEIISNENQVKDGMDLSLCIVTDKKTVSYCGANNECYIIRKNDRPMPVSNDQIKITKRENFSVIELKPTKRPVGVFESEYEFKSVELQLEKGDLFYLFSDGYADQFGGPKGKKMKTSSFRDAILDAAHLPLQEQKQYLQNHLDNWQQNFDQLDDITVLSVKVE